MMVAAETVATGGAVSHRPHQVNSAGLIKVKRETIPWACGLQNLASSLWVSICFQRLFEAESMLRVFVAAAAEAEAYQPVN
jgi:hypothetical protein